MLDFNPYCAVFNKVETSLNYVVEWWGLWEVSRIKCIREE
jgi:hypothetical protein